MFLYLLVVSLFAAKIFSFYVPESGSDWTLLQPDQQAPVENHRSVPFEFGLVVTPFEVDHFGSYFQPKPEPVVPQTVTVVKTETVVSVALPTKTADVVQIADGQVQRAADSDDCDDSDSGESEPKYKRDDDCTDDDESDSEEECVYAVSCATSATLLITLENGILRDSQGRIGSIVGSRQFQFDGPVPQYGTIYASGWLISRGGRLTLGNSTVFWQCSSGDFYNLYDTQITLECGPVSLDVVKLVEC